MSAGSSSAIAWEELPGERVARRQARAALERIEVARAQLGFPQLERFGVQRDRLGQARGMFVVERQIMAARERIAVVGAQFGLAQLECRLVQGDRLGIWKLCPYASARL